MTERHGLLRGRREEDARVGFIELFFDLVFVFAVTQLSHYLIAHLSIAGAAQATMLFAAVWWVWVYTIWCTNWLDTDAWPVRLMLFAMMAGGLVLAMVIPKAFAGGGLIFALAFATLQIDRSLFMMAVLYRRPRDNFLNFRRITIWAIISGLLWVCGGFADPQVRMLWWLAALTIDFSGPALRFKVHGLGASSLDDWNVEAHHLSERCGLFVIIALGESVLLTGATFSASHWSTDGALAFVSAFVTSAAMWWIYFNVGAEQATRNFAQADDTGKIARAAYTYLHMPIVAGIIVNAASDEMLIAHPAGHGSAAVLALLIGGPALFLASVLVFKRAPAGGWRLSHLVGLAGFLALLAVGAVGHDIPPLPVGIGVMLVSLLVVAAWETIAIGDVRKAEGVEAH